MTDKVYTLSYLYNYLDHFLDKERYYISIFEKNENPHFQENEVVLYTKEFTGKTIILENLHVINKIMICKFSKEKKKRREEGGV